MPRDYPEWPTGAQVQAYLASYASHFGLDQALRLSTEVTSAAPAAGGGWTVTAADGREPSSVDRLVVANGVFCEPAMPRYPGRGRVRRGRRPGARRHRTARRGAGAGQAGAGRRLRQVGLRRHGAGQPGRGEHRRDRPAPAVEGAAPHRRGPQLQDAAAHPHGRGPLQVPAPARRREVPARPGQRHARPHDQLDRLGVGPPVRAQAARAGAPRADGGHRARGDRPRHRGLLRGRRGRAASSCTPTGPSPGCWPTAATPAAELDDGTRLPADLIVCATGFTQGVPFLPADVTSAVLDERGNFMLYRQIRPVDVPGLYFNGYNSSFFSPLNAEMAALWIAADLAGAVTLPEPAGDAPAGHRAARVHGCRHRHPPLPRREDHPVLACTTWMRCSVTSA